MIGRILKRFTSLMLVVVMVIVFMPDTAKQVYANEYGGEVTGLSVEGIGLTYSGTNSWKVTGDNSITGSEKSFAGCGTTDYESTLIITDKRDDTAVLSFNYSVVLSGGTIKVDGNPVTTGGSFEKKLGKDESVEVYFKTNNTEKNLSIIIENIALVADTNPKVTFVSAENGSYTVDGATVADRCERTQSSLTAYQVVATPDKGYKFLGWYVAADNTYISTSASASLNIEKDCTVTAKFASEESAIFKAGSQPFVDLNAAAAYAQTNGTNKVILTSDGIISGNYTIPAGVTLLIPFDNAGTLYTDTPGTIRTTPTSKPFRTLTMGEGSTITVNGAISIGGRYYAAGGGERGKCVGDYGYIKMEEGSSIAVKEGGDLYAWGFISGSGSVMAESGATVYEFYQIADFRGGTASSAMGNKVFPFSQYYVQNIEVPLTICSGAVEKLYSGLFALSSTYNTGIEFIGSNGMFRSVSGSITKDYDEERDRLVFSVAGEAELNALSLTLMGSKINSADYVLPITNNVTLNINSGGMTINQDIALLPGTEVNIAKDAEVNVASGRNLYVYDRDEWTNNSYTCAGKFAPVQYAPGKKYNRTEKELTDAKINVNGTLVAEGSIYTTKGGANICSSSGTGIYKQESAPGTEENTYQYTQSDKSVTLHEIPITPAKLQDGNYCIETATAAVGDKIEWGHSSSSWDNGAITKEATCTETGIKTFTCRKCKAKRTEVVAATGHSYGNAVYTWADDGSSCTAEKECSACSDRVTEKGTVTSQVTTAATCTVQGTTTYTATFTGEGFATQTKDVVDINATGHEWSGWTKVDDNNHRHVCQNDASHSETVAHIWDEGVTTKEATCTAEGEKKYTCSDCSATKTEQIAKIAHTAEKVEETAATCTVDGNKEYYTCTECGKYFEDENCTKEISDLDAWKNAGGKIDATGHSYGNAKYTWSEDGKSCTAEKVCSACNDKVTEEGEVTSEVKAAATCTVQGTTTYTATFKGDGFAEQTKDVTDIDATGHKWSSWTRVDDNNHRRVCQNDASHSETKAHSWNAGEITTKATCTGEGVKTFTCENCSATKTEAVAKVAHKAEKVDGTAATCTANGNKAYYKCSACSQYFTDEACTNVIEDLEAWKKADGKIDATGHNWGEWTEEDSDSHKRVCQNDDSHSETKAHSWNDGVITKEATCTETGIKTFTCKECNAKRTEVVAATGHSYGDAGYTWENGGSSCTAVKVCSACNDKVTEEGTITSKVKTAATCETEGTTTYTATFTGKGFATQTKDVADIDATGHDWGNWTEADNKNHKRICENNSSHSETTAHIWDEGVITKEATCTAEGEKKYTCSDCSATKTEQIAKIAHTAEKVEETAATCTEDGNKEYYTCTECDRYFEDENCTKEISNLDAWKNAGGKIAATGHSYGNAKYTWSEDGKSCTAEKVCRACNDKVTEEGTIKSEVKTAATCEAKGTTTYTATFTEEGFATQTKDIVDINAKGHTEETVEGKAATCTEAGITDGKKCSVCNSILEVQTEIQATGHKWSSWTKVDDNSHERTCQNDESHSETAEHSWNDGVITTEATCTEAGVRTFTCADCNATKTEAVAEVEHKAEEVGETKATCTVNGNEAYYRCSTCNQYFTDEACANVIEDLEAWKEAEGKIAATGHSYGNAKYTWSEDGKSCTAEKVCSACNDKVTEEGTITSKVKTAATCETEGTTTYTATFTGEGFATQTKDIDDINAAGHKLTKTEAKEATCAADGNNEYWTCDKCHKVFKADKETETTAAAETIAAGHTPEEVAERAATCTEAGQAAGTKCSVCGETLTGMEEIPAKGHTEVNDEAVAATCTTAGKTEGKHCSVCNTVLVAQTKVPAAGHKLTKTEAKEATCAADGNNEYWTCDKCHKVFKADKVTETTVEVETIAAAHSPEDVAEKAATCTEAGHAAGTKCSVCGETLSGMDEIPAKGHTEVNDEAVDATCTTAGKTEGKHCSVCKKVLVAQEVVAATGHTEVIDAAIEVTCTTAGKTEGKHCSVCNTVLIAQEEAPAAGHSWNETYTVDKPASCTEKGSESIHCKNCNETKDSREIPATGHVYKDGKCESCGIAKPSSYSGGAAIAKPTINIINKDGNSATNEKPSTTVAIAATASGNNVAVAIDTTTASKMIEKAEENKSEEIVVKVDSTGTATACEVSISAESIKIITEKTGANLVIETGESKVDLDKAAMAAVIEKSGSSGTVKFNVETVKSDNSVCNVSLKVVTEAETITNFGKGTVAVTVAPTKKLAAKNLVCVYINEKGIYSKVKGKKNEDGTFTFMASKF